MPSCDSVNRCMPHFLPGSWRLLFPLLSGVHCQGTQISLHIPAGSHFLLNLFMVSHYGTSWTFLYPKFISFVHFFFLDKCSYSSNLNEPILPKVFVVLHGLTMWLHRVVPYPLQPPGTRLAVRKELSQTNMSMLSYLKIGPGNINCPVSKNCPASSPLGAPHQPQVGLLERLQISLQCKWEFCSWSWPIMANVF